MRLGHPLVDRYLEFVAARARTNTLLATGYDPKVFFSVVAKEPTEVTTVDLLEFITAQRGGRHLGGRLTPIARARRTGQYWGSVDAASQVIGNLPMLPTTRLLGFH